MFVEQEDRAPNVPVVNDKVKEVVIQLGDDLGDEKPLIMVGPQQYLFLL